MGEWQVDNISSADGIIWIFIGVFLVIVVLIIASCTLWTNNRKISSASHIILVFLLALINLNSVHYLILWTTWKNSLFSLIIYESIFIIVSIFLMIISSLARKKRRIYSNLLMHCATFLCLLAFFIIQRAVNL